MVKGIAPLKGSTFSLCCAGVLEDMEAHGVECIDCYSVDNALVRLGDPVFAGFCHERDVDTGKLAGVTWYRCESWLSGKQRRPICLLVAKYRLCWCLVRTQLHRHF